jgi:hypothetical protein
MIGLLNLGSLVLELIAWIELKMTGMESHLSFFMNRVIKITLNRI